jgi:titin
MIDGSIPLGSDGQQPPLYAIAPRIILNGAGAGFGASGLDLEAGSDGSTVQGFVIQGFSSGNGIVLNGTSNNTVTLNYIGTNPAGVVTDGNGGVGILLTGPARGNTIGSSFFGAGGNVLSGNAIGIAISGTGASANLIEGNMIGTDVSGTHVLGNAHFGVAILGGASANSVGGLTFQSDNVIAGNRVGVLLAGSGTSNNVVANNEIGTNRQGNAAPGNTVGVAIGEGATANRIGFSLIVSVPAGNVISGNIYGVLLTDAGTSGNVVLSNRIGTAADGKTALGNIIGVVVSGGASANTIGGAFIGPNNDQAQPINVISGNNYGLVLAGASQNLVEGNFIGTDVSGAAALSNADAGVLLEGGAMGNTVGGSSANLGNVISGNGYGLLLTDAGTSRNTVEGNSIGSDLNVTVNIDNIFGVAIENEASGNTVGGTAPGSGNTIAFGFASGVVVVGNSTTGDSILGNSI